MRLHKTLLAGVVISAYAQLAAGQELVVGEGRAALGSGTSAEIRAAAKQEAVRDAVLKAIKDATALDASNPKFAPLVDEIAKQSRDVRVDSEASAGSEFVTRVQVSVDRKQIKNAIRGTELDKLNDRSFSMLLLVDEFLTSTRDLNMPLEELTEFKYDAGSSFRDKSIKAKASNSSSSAAVAHSASLNASGSRSGSIKASEEASFSAQNGNANAAAAGRGSLQASHASSASVSAKESYAAAAASKSANSSVDAKNVSADSHEKASYKHLVKYQDTSKPTNRAQFLGSFSGRLRDYDLRLLDSANAKSQFFGNRTINLGLLSNSAEMSKFSEYARTKANADFLLMGTSTVVAGEINPSTGAMSCAVNAEVRAFATATGEVVAAMSDSAQASGLNIEACAAVASKKIADLMAPGFASSALGYWADRAARGRQYTVELKGSNLALPMRMAFAKALRDIAGATAVEKKEDGPDGVKVTLTLKGGADPMEQVYGAVSSQAAFSGKSLDGTVVGELVTLCPDKCGQPARSAPKKR
jgi:hypothetical protein